MHDARYLSRKDVEYRKRLYNQGFDDNEIAKRTGLTQNGIYYWRVRNNLSSNAKWGLPENENKYRMELYKQGLTDKEIAKAAGIQRDSIGFWRKKNNLLVNREDMSIQLDFTPSWELGYLIGLTVGDGSLGKHQRSFTLDFRSTRKKYIDLIESILKKVFPQLSATRCTFFANTRTPSGHKYHVKYYDVSCSSKNLYYFMKRYKKSNFVWLTPNDQPDIMKYGFIGGIIDADGSVTKSYVRVSSKHKENLVRLKRLLQELGFIYGKLSIKKQGNHFLNICGRRNHRLLLEKAKMPYKREQLERYVKETKRYTAEQYWQAIRVRNETGWGNKRIGNVLNISQWVVANWIYKNRKPQSLSLAEKYGGECSDV